MVSDTRRDIVTTRSAAAAHEPVTALSDVIQRVVDLAHRHLGMDVTYVSRFSDGRQTYRALRGDADSFGMEIGDGPALPGTYCSRMVVGEIPHLIPDTSTDNRVRYLPITHQNKIGAYIGVPLRLSDGTLYGTLCCLSHEADHTLTARDVHYLHLLADLLIADLDLEHELSQTRALVTRVLDQGTLQMALQPVFRLTDGRRLGVEGLARFPAEFGTPETLFPAARSVGLTVELEQLTATRALELAPTLAPDEFLSINMSPPSIMAWESLVAGLPSLTENRLVLEVTEHQAIDEYAEVKASIAALRERGIRIAIDDVGAGYASLHHVLQLEPDFIKIDRKLVDGSAGDSARRSVIRGFVALARDIGAIVIGEGVEQPADLQVLRDLGVDAAQGYLLGRPTIEHPRPTTRDIGRGGSTSINRLPLPRPA